MRRPATGQSIIKIAATASAGAAIEWYDFFIYGTAAALVFPKLFFPADLPPFVAQIAAFSTFAVGFLARPLGGLVFGHFGDLFGRKRALSVALLIMGAATTGVGLLPTYATAGVLAPLLLVILRFVQGLAVGGQWGGAALLAIESAPPGRRGFYGSFVQIGVPLGVVLANVVFLLAGVLLPSESFLAWGWRVPFLLSVALVAIGIYVQLVLEEPEAFEQARAKAPPKASPLIQVLKDHRADVLLAGGAFIANNTCFYVAITYAVAYGASTVGIPKETMLAAVMIGSVVMAPALIVCGALSDRIGRRGIFMLGAVLSGLWAFAVFPLIETGSPVAITAAIGVELVLISLMYGPQAALFAELFPVEVRYSGASLGYQIGSVFGGGFAPIIATALFERFRSSEPISIYLAAMCAVSLACTAILARRASKAPNNASASGPPV
jgi:metabolite-proton symporter